MYGFDGTHTALEWLSVTGNPMSLTLEDRQKWRLHRLANENRAPVNNKNQPPRSDET